MNVTMQHDAAPGIASPPLATIRVSAVDSLEAVPGGAQAWNRLVDASTYPNVFRRWEWVNKWWNWFGGNRHLYLRIVMRGSELLGIVPMYRTVTRLGVKTLNWIGAGGPTFPEYLGPIVHQDRATEVVAEIANHFRSGRGNWDKILFPDTAPDDLATIQLITALAETHSTIRAPGEICAYFFFPSSFEGLMARLTSHGRQRKKRQLRRAKEELEASLDVSSDVETISEWFPTMKRLSISSKERAGQVSPFLNLEYAGFHRDACRALGRASLSRVYMLLLRGSPAAFLYGFLYQGKFYAFQTGYDCDLEAYSPGDILFQMVYEHLIGEKAEEFDYLRGGEAYKRQFADLERRTETTLVFRRRGIGYVTDTFALQCIKKVRSAIKNYLLNRTAGRNSLAASRSDKSSTQP